MSQIRRLSPRDLETLSAYLDGQLSPAETARLQLRLSREASLQEGLEELRWTSSALRSLPSVPIPRSFTLHPTTAPARRAAPWYPTLQLGTALAGIALVAVVGLDVLQAGQLAAASRALTGQAPAMEAPAATGAELFAAQLVETPTAAYGLGEAEDGLPPPAGTAAPALPAAVAPTPSPTEVKAGDEAPVEDALRSAPVPGAAEEEAAMAESTGWPAVRYAEIGLGVLTVVLGALTLTQRRRTSG